MFPAVIELPSAVLAVPHGKLEVCVNMKPFSSQLETADQLQYFLEVLCK